VSLKNPADGPDGMFSTEAPPSRGQWQTIAQLALQALDLKVPTTRLGATIQTARLRAAIERGDNDPRHRA
jgi:hypothetical protein